MNGVKWQKWTGSYNESLGQFGKTHATSDDIKTMCGVTIPSQQEANVEGESLGRVDCKKCSAKAAAYEAESRDFDRNN